MSQSKNDSLGTGLHIKKKKYHWFFLIFTKPMGGVMEEVKIENFYLECHTKKMSLKTLNSKNHHLVCDEYQFAV